MASGGKSLSHMAPEPAVACGLQVCGILLVVLAVGIAPGCSDKSPRGLTASPGLWAACTGRSAEAPADEARIPSTFSIVALDPATGDLGVAVASKFLAVGAVVPWVKAGVGAVATQSYANTSFGPRGLRLLAEGKSPEEAARALIEADPEGESRQIGIVDAQGRAHSWTGKSCIAWAGSRTSGPVAVQGNILVSEATLEAMLRAFSQSRGELAERLMVALEAGQRAGGDARGRQSAALIVERKNGGYGGFNDRHVDLRVDDHPDPVRELRRLLLLQTGKDPLSQARRFEFQSNPREALKVLEEGLASSPHDNTLRFEIARLLFILEKDGEGKAALQEALERTERADTDHLRAAGILAEVGRKEDCLREIGETLRRNPEMVHVFRREIENPASRFQRWKAEIQPLLEPRAQAPR